MAEERMTLAALAAELEISGDTVRQWQKRGLPGRKRGGGWWFDVEKVREWVLTYQRPRHDGTAVGRADADMRKAVALADLRELELRKRRGEVIARDAMREAVGAMAYTLRTRLQGLPQRMASVCEGKRADEIERTLAGEIAALLRVVAAAPFAETGAGDAAVCARCRSEAAA